MHDYLAEQAAPQQLSLKSDLKFLLNQPQETEMLAGPRSIVVL